MISIVSRVLRETSIVTVLLCSVMSPLSKMQLLADDIIATLDGTEYSGRIVQEDAGTVHLEMPNGTIIIPKNIISSIKLEQSWQIENHVDRLNEPAQADIDCVPTKDVFSFDGMIYFPIKTGNWWKYTVRYKPETLYGNSLIGKNREFSSEWCVKEITTEPIRGVSLFQHTSTYAARLSIIEDENESDAKEMLLFIGTRKQDKRNAYLVMRKLLKNESDSFFIRLLPLQPFLKQNKRWIDTGKENALRFTSQSEVIGIEGIETSYGFFDNCVVVERVDRIENQSLTSTTYTWYAPNVGMVKMVQEIAFPQEQNGDLTKSFILQEYEIIKYGVRNND